MKASDLRIGNMVKLMDGSVLTVSAIDIMQFTEHFKPIPLTEEWLVKFGFEGGDIHYWHPDSDYSIEKLGGAWEVYHSQNPSYYGTTVNYVHQLQNLYFALTGEELICNSK